MTPGDPHFDDGLLEDDERTTLSANFSTAKFKISLGIVFVVNFLANGAIGYALSSGNRIRLWENGKKGDPVFNVEVTMWFDMMLSSFIVSWLNWVANAGGVRKAVAAAEYTPVPDRHVRSMPWNIFPLLMDGWVLQSLAVAFEVMLISSGMVFLIFLMASVDDVQLESWFWIKGFFMGLVAALTYVLAVASWTTTHKLPQADIDSYSAVRARGTGDSSPYGTG